MQTTKPQGDNGAFEEASDADSDLEELQGDIAKFDESVREFLASHRGEGDATRHIRRAGRGRGPRGPRKAAKPRGDIAARLAKVNQAFLSGNYDQALETAFEIIRINAETHQAWVALSSIFRERGEMDRALSAMVYAAHLRPKDVSGWLQCASFAMEVIADDETVHLHTARLCFSAALRADRTNVEARIGKAEVCHLQGHLSAAISEYINVLKSRPDDIEIIRKLAEACIDSNNIVSAVPSAVSAYRQYFDGRIAQPRTENHDLLWHDICAYVELIASTEDYREAVHELKRVSRWLLEWPAKASWDQVQNGDREWNIQDDRRSCVDPDTTNSGDKLNEPFLPLELRIRLAIYHSKLGEQEEALNHLNLLDPAQSSTQEFAKDFPFLVYDLGTELYRIGQIDLAKRYLTMLRSLPGAPDALVLLQLGRYHLDSGEQEAAEELFLAALEIDEDNVDARIELANLYERARESEEALILAAEAMALREAQELPLEQISRQDRSQTRHVSRSAKRQPRRLLRQDTAGQVASLGGEAGRPRIPKRYRPKRLAAPDKRRQDEQARALKLSQHYEIVRDLKHQISAGREDLVPVWMASSKELIDDFRSLKRFYTWDKYLNFLGPKLPTQTGLGEPANTQLAQMYERLTRSVGPQSEQSQNQSQGLSVATHQGITFDNWLNLFLDYAIGLAFMHQREDAYQVCAAARDSTVFQSSKHNFEIHVAWSVCAIYTNDEERCITIARHLMRDGVSSDSCRMFALVSMLCQSPVSWYTSGPAQKYILRQIKAMDASHQSSACLSKVDNVDVDVCLLMLYGHILFTSTSYSHALGYFLRARSVDPNNAMVNFSLGLAYVHYGLKRQSTNRQYLILQGQFFLSEYARQDNQLSTAAERAYNMGRLFQLLGISHLSSAFYNRALCLCKDHIRRDELSCLVLANTVISLLTVGNVEVAFSVLKANIRL